MRHDTEISMLLEKEMQRQEEQISLIPSENYISSELLYLYQKSLPLNNKYAEGYPSQRYYGGCHYVDEIENIAIARAKKLFNVEYANVQPHSGSQANAAVFMALLQPGDCILSMGLSHGGHLTHGAKVNFSGKLYRSVAYGINTQERIDYEQVEVLAKQHRPKLIIAGYSAYAREIHWERFRSIADQVGAFFLADISHIAGLVAAKVHSSPMQYAHVVTTTTHKTLRGPRGGMILAQDMSFAKKFKLNAALFPGIQGGPLMHIIAAKAIAFFEALQPSFKNYQLQTLHNAQGMAMVLRNRNIKLVSDGTDNHLILIDLRNKSLSGKTAEIALEKSSIITNKNMLPHDPNPPSITSGLRIGTPAITTRKFMLSEAKQVAHWIADILENPDSMQQLSRIKKSVSELCIKFPVYTAGCSAIQYDS